jgi:arylsulfatase A-like enzyme/Flp pilus assembly protein TadD
MWILFMKSIARFRISVFFLLAIAIILIPLGVFYQRFYGRSIRNVVVISIDTCRADYLGCYGYEGNTTPNIDNLAAEGIVFQNVVSPMPLTLPAHCSMLTGKGPLNHGVHDNEGYVLGEGQVMLSEILKSEGFVTGAVVSSFVLDNQFGLSQGFDTYQDRFDDVSNSIGIVERRGEEATRKANLWLQEHKGKRFFLFLHYFDPHFTYDPPEPFKSNFAKNPYAGEIAYTDHCIGQVIKKLKDLDLYDSTLLIITSDHGEDLGEHGENYHGYYIYQSTVRVPLIFRLPDSEKVMRIEETAGLIDIVPTVCSLLGIKSPAGVDGQDVSGYFNGKGLKNGKRSFYCESLLATRYGCNPLLGIVEDGWKYILTSQPELYDLRNDPAEKSNLIEKEAGRARLMRGTLKRTLSEAMKVKGHVQDALDDESKARLASLGYVSGGDLDESYEIDAGKSDAKDMLEFHVLDSRASFYVHQGKFAEVKELCGRMLEMNSEYSETYNYLGRAFLAEDAHEKAVENFSRYVELRPGQAGGYNNLGLAFYQVGRRDEAVEVLAKAIELNPDFAEAYYNLGRVLGLRGEFENAIRHLEKARELMPWQEAISKELERILERQDAMAKALKAVEAEPDSPEAHYNLARIYFGQERYSLSFEHCERALQADTLTVDLRLNIAQALLALRRLKPVVEQLRLVLAAEPDKESALNALAWILATAEDAAFADAEEAVSLAKRACELTDYKAPSVIDTLGAALAASGDFERAVEMAEKASTLAEAGGRKDLAAEIRERLILYRQDNRFYDFKLSQEKK